jgi:NADH-quinone oxidoreductase subunit L
MTIPLVLLAFFAATVGFVAFDYGSAYHGFGSFLEMKGKFEVRAWLTLVSLALAALGLALGWATYQRGAISHVRLAKRYGWAYRVLSNKYYIDEAYQWVIDRLVLVFGRLVGLFDRVVVNDTGVDGSAITVRLSALKLRLSQTGKFHNYGMGMALGVVALALVWWLVQT